MFPPTRSLSASNIYPARPPICSTCFATSSKRRRRGKSLASRPRRTSARTFASPSFSHLHSPSSRFATTLRLWYSLGCGLQLHDPAGARSDSHSPQGQPGTSQPSGSVSSQLAACSTYVNGTSTSRSVASLGKNGRALSGVPRSADFLPGPRSYINK